MEENTKKDEKDDRDKSKKRRERSPSPDKSRDRNRDRDRISRERDGQQEDRHQDDSTRDRKKKVEKDNDRRKDDDKNRKRDKESGIPRDKDRLLDHERRRSHSRSYDCEYSKKSSKHRRRRSKSRSRSGDRGSSKRYDREADDRSSRDYRGHDSKHRRRRSKSRSRSCDRGNSKRYDRDFDDRSTRDGRGHDSKHRRRRSKSRSRSCDRGNSKRYDREFDERSNRDGRGGGGHDKDRNNYARNSKIDDIKTETRESRLDLTQTIQELMNSSASTKNFAALFNCTNSNDSLNNGPSDTSSMDGSKKSRKKSRWGGTENDKTFIPGMPTILPSTLDPTQQEAYLVQLQIEEISRKLRTGELGIPQLPEERSPSPEPIYSSDGKRLNTREFRFRKRLEEQRHQLIVRMQSVNPDFKPPADYKPPVIRVSDKVLIPQEQHPDINFVGLLIGPRGNTLKAMEKETGAKIIIRGKGSVKEGKVGRKDGQPLPGEDEPLHAFITASNPDAVKKAVNKINEVIRQGIEVPEGHNDLRRMQLRELAQLNGTLRETDCPRCTNCGSIEHKSWLCPDKPNVTNSIVCTLCGGAGHISKDCISKRQDKGEGEGPANDDSQAKIDEEYMSLMAELGEGPVPHKTTTATADPLAQAHLNRGYSLFDARPSQPKAIAAPPPVMSQPKMKPSQIIPPSWLTNGPPMPPHPTLMQPPPVPPPPPPMMPWMPPLQPPPPGGEMSNPPGTGPISSLLPPPPGTSNTPLPSWTPPPLPGVMHPFSWNQNGGVGSYLQPPAPGVIPPPPAPGVMPPPPPCAPPPPALPPGIHGQLNSSPPPPPPN